MTTATTNTTPPPTHVMQCMEVWGGNSSVNNGVAMPGLDAWVFSRPFGCAPGSGSDTSIAPITAEDGSDPGGGDIHYVTSCATGRITRMTIADVSGHGRTVARAAESLRRLMRRHSNYIDQARFVEALNREFGELALESEAVSSRAMFATAVVATYFAPTDELSISIAGHPRPMHFRPSKGWAPLSAGTAASGPANLPLGVLDSVTYPQASVRLGRGDLVLFYTDSLIEARGPDGRLLGEAGLARALAGLETASPESLIPALLERLCPAAGPGFDDDVTALLVRRNDLKPRPGVALGLKAGGLLAAAALRSLARGVLPDFLPEFNIRALGGAFVKRLNGGGKPR